MRPLIQARAVFLSLTADVVILKAEMEKKLVLYLAGGVSKASEDVLMSQQPQIVAFWDAEDPRYF